MLKLTFTTVIAQPAVACGADTLDATGHSRVALEIERPTPVLAWTKHMMVATMDSHHRRSMSGI